MEDQELAILWQAALGEFEVTLSKANYTTWLKKSFLAKIEGNKATIGTDNNFSKQWLVNKFMPQIAETLGKLTDGQVTEVDCVVRTKAGEPKQNNSPLIPSPVEKSATPVKSSQYTQQIPKLNPKYTFDNFIVGGSNSLAHAAALAVAENPGHSYNPLFVYGGVGLGKTHLIQAIAHAILEKEPSTSIVYITTEQFMNDFIDSVKQGKASDFKHVFRNADMLLIDDIQFIAGKEATQEEFFHTFNTLYQKNKQIILTSDRLPKAIPTLEARLSSRFECGLVVDVNPPDVETRCAIIKSKCEEHNFELDDKTIVFMAQSIASNIREIEGALNRLIAYCNLNKTTPNEETIKKVLEQFITSAPQKAVNHGKIIKTVAAYYGISIDEIVGTKRNKELVYPRQVSMYLIRSELNTSFPLIGKEFGGKDHTTIMHACDKIEKEISKNEALQKDISTLKERIYTIS